MIEILSSNDLPFKTFKFIDFLIVFALVSSTINPPTTFLDKVYHPLVQYHNFS